MMRYKVNDSIIEYQAIGETHIGADIVLLDRAEDLTAATSWSATGYTIQTLFPEQKFLSFQKRTHELLLECWRKSGLMLPEDFSLENYHRYAIDQKSHLAAVEFTKLLSTDLFPEGISNIETRISEICGVDLKAQNPYDQQRIFHFRVVRPLSKDNNPLHRDIWLEDYDNCINLYIPIAGSNERSSLIIFPESHRWPESKIRRTSSGALINGVKFNVPAVTEIFGSFTIERPDPRQNEVLIFSPYLVHGGSVNLNEDETRISIELRLWRK